MKTRITHTIASLLIVGSLAASCNGCDRNKDNPTPADTVATVESEAVDTTVMADANAVDESAASDASSETKSKSAANSSVRKSDKNGNSTKGYSAADGTDAENHDGDQYTRNDQKPMPTGPPMK